MVAVSNRAANSAVELIRSGSGPVTLSAMKTVVVALSPLVVTQLEIVWRNSWTQRIVGHFVGGAAFAVGLLTVITLAH